MTVPSFGWGLSFGRAFTAGSFFCSTWTLTGTRATGGLFSSRKKKYHVKLATANITTTAAAAPLPISTNIVVLLIFLTGFLHHASSSGVKRFFGEADMDWT